MKELMLKVVVSLSALLCCVPPASAQNSDTVSAKGSGVAPIESCAPTKQSGFECSVGGDGLHFNFSFSGPAPVLPFEPVPAFGTFRAVNRDVDVKYEFVSGDATIFPLSHQLKGTGICTETTSLGVTTIGVCEFFAWDRANPGGENHFFFGFTGIQSSTITLTSEVVNGNMEIAR